MMTHPVLPAVLIVEDEEAQRAIIKRTFDEAQDKYRLTFASTLQEAKQIISVNSLDIIVTDYLLPDGKGSELIGIVAGANPIPVLLMTAHGDEQIAVSSMKAGAVDYIVKSTSTLLNLPYIVKSAWIEWNSEITRKKLREALAVSESKYHEIFNSVNDAIQMHRVSESGAPGQFIDVNDVACRMLGYTREELLSKGPMDIVSGYHNRPVQQIFDELVATGSSRFETEHVRKDGMVVPVEVNAHVVTIQGEKVAISVIRDITEQKKAESELRRSAEKYRVLIESAGEAIFVIRDGKIPYANRKALQLISYDADSLSKTNFIEFVHPDDHPEAAERHLKRLRGEPIDATGILRIVDRQNDIHWLDINAVLIDWDGTPATLNFATDITKRKKAELAMKESEEKYRTVIENIQDVFYRTDMNGILTMASPSLAKVFGYDSVVECIGHPIDELFHCPSEKRTELLKVLDEKGMAENFEIEMKKKNGQSLIISTNSHYYYEKSGVRQGVEGILRDITGKKRAETALIESLREKEVLLKEIHHRVKNNLQIVSGLMYLQANVVRDKEVKDILSACRNRISSMALLHENLYQISDLASVAMSPYINNLIANLSDSYDVEGRIRFEIDVAEDVNLDIDTGIAMGIIITELVTNAVKYAYPPEEKGVIRVILRQTGSGIVLTVADCGKGLPAGTDLTSGTGLGMKLVNNLVRQIHGTIAVTSTKGTTVEIVAGTGVVKIKR